MKREFLYLRIGHYNPKVFVDGRATERRKEERKTEAFDRYFEMLKGRKEALEQEKAPETKQPRIKNPIMPVSSPQSPVIQQRQ